jgi:hypothetical protein
MKRIALFSIATIAALFSSACERFPSTQLPEHYKHKMHASTDAHGAAAEHPKADAHAPAAPNH